MAGKKVQITVESREKVSDEVFFEARNLSRKGEFQNVSFEIHKGEILGVAGLVGAGRTEIFKSVFGITEKDLAVRLLLREKKYISNPL